MDVTIRGNLRLLYPSPYSSWNIQLGAREMPHWPIPQKGQNAKSICLVEEYAGQHAARSSQDTEVDG